MASSSSSSSQSTVWHNLEMRKKSEISETWSNMEQHGATWSNMNPDESA
jgi:hypothetical protein